MVTSGVEALLRGDRHRSRAAWHEAEESYFEAIQTGDEATVPLAKWGLGVVRYMQGSRDSAVALWEEAASSSHLDAQARALNSLGVAYWDSDRRADARATWQQVIDFGHERASWLALINLGIALKEDGNLTEAESLLRRAASSPDLELQAKAALLLGELLAEQARLPEAAEAYRQAIECGDPNYSSTALREFAQVFMHHNATEVREAYARFIPRAPTDVAAAAAMDLAALFETAADWDTAAALYSSAISLGGSGQAATAALKLGWLLEGLGDWEGARYAYSTAARAGDSEISATATRDLSALLLSVGDEKSATRLRLSSTADRQGDAIEASEPCRELEQALAGDVEEVPDDRVRELIKTCSAVLALGFPSGEVTESRATESDLLHVTLGEDSDEEERVYLPLFTREGLMRLALLRNPKWQSPFALQFQGEDLLANLGPDVWIILNPWTRLERTLPPTRPA